MTDLMKRQVKRPPLLAPLVIELREPPVASEPASIHKGPGRKITKGPTWNAPRPPLADVYDDDLPPAA